MGRTLRLGTLLAGMLLVASGGYLAYPTLTGIADAEATVDATVLESEIRPEGRFEDDYRLHVEYSYTYDGRPYRSTNVYPGPGGKVIDEEGTARETIGNYPEGETVTAYVNPDDPDESYLIQVGLVYTVSTALFGVLFVGVGLLIAVLAGGTLLMDYVRPGPDEVTPVRDELREQFEEAFREIDDYPVEEYRDVRFSSLDPQRKFESNDFEVTVIGLDDVVESDPDAPCEDAEELAEYFVGEMEEKGYFY